MPGIYIMSSEPQSGKAIVALGIMEALAGRVHRLSVFRPLVHEGDEQDRLIKYKAHDFSPRISFYVIPGFNIRGVLNTLSPWKRNQNIFNIICDCKVKIS